MAAKPQKAPAIDWEEFDKLLVPEKPSSEWVSKNELEIRYKRKFDVRNLRKIFECKKFLKSNGKYCNYYRPKK